MVASIARFVSQMEDIELLRQVITRYRYPSFYDTSCCMEYMGIYMFPVRNSTNPRFYQVNSYYTWSFDIPVVNGTASVNWHIVLARIINAKFIDGWILFWRRMRRFTFRENLFAHESRQFWMTLQLGIFNLKSQNLCFLNSLALFTEFNEFRSLREWSDIFDSAVEFICFQLCKLFWLELMHWQTR